MRKLVAVILLIISTASYAGGTSYEIMLLSLVETKADEYILKYKVLNTEDIYEIHLSYSPMEYLLKARFLTEEKYTESIKLLKEQFLEKKPVRFGWFGGGPCALNKEKSVYRSDALDIYNEGNSDKGPFVVYAFCEYK